MKDAIKFGFGFALGAYLFKLCGDVTWGVVEKCFEKKFDEDPEFRVRVKTVSPELYVRYRKENKTTQPSDPA